MRCVAPAPSQVLSEVRRTQQLDVGDDVGERRESKEDDVGERRESKEDNVGIRREGRVGTMLA